MDIEEEHAKLLSRLEKEYEDMVRRASADDDKGDESDQGEKAGTEIELESVGGAQLQGQCSWYGLLRSHGRLFFSSD